MNLFKKAKDGGPESPVDAYFLIEVKSLFSIALLKFNKGGREAYHTHAFHALTWFLKGDLLEEDIDGSTYKYTKSIFPKVTKRTKFHRVKASVDSWCLTLRGPWSSTWKEYEDSTGKTTTLAHDRRVVSVS